MPIPKPNPGEHREQFISRCMGNETMLRDFPEQDQRYAVCIQQIGKSDIEAATETIKEFLTNLNNPNK